ncbi:MAG: hypothetical protein ACK4GO_06245 [Gemmobacter sp.]
MARIEFGTSSPEVKSLQKLMNQVLPKGKIKETGTYDEDTRTAMALLQDQLNVGHSSGLPDQKTMAAMKEALIPRTRIVVNGKEAWVTREQFAQLKRIAGARAAEAVRPYVSMANEAMMYWEAHDSARKDNAFWSKFVDVAVGLKFPSKATMVGAVKAAEAMEKDARDCALTPADISRRAAPIRQAFADMDQYRDELFMGGGQLVRELEKIRDGCVLTLQVTAAFATGGSSWGVQVGVSAGVAAYDAVLKEVDKASKTANYAIEAGLSSVFMATVCDATVGLILKGGGAKDITDDIAKAALKEATHPAMKKLVVDSLNGGAQQMLKDGINGLPGLADPKKKFDASDLAEAAVKSFIKGAGLKILGSEFKKFGESASKHVKPEMFKGLGLDPSKLDKTGEEGFKKLVDKRAGKILDDVAKNWDVTKDDAAKFADEVIKAYQKDGALRDFIKEQMKKAKK